MSLTPDHALERRVIAELETLGLTNPENHVAVFAAWEGLNLAITIGWTKLVKQYSGGHRIMQTRHTYANAGADMTNVLGFARTAALDSIGTAMYEWCRSGETWPREYPQVELLVRRENGAVAGGTQSAVAAAVRG